jgi:hypothetical protein
MRERLNGGARGPAPAARLTSEVTKDSLGGVSNHPVSEKIPPWLLWQRLSRLEIFENFSDDQRDAFLKAYEKETRVTCSGVAHRSSTGATGAMLVTSPAIALQT